DGAAVFKGEVVGIEPVFDAGGESRVVVHAFNRLHRLTHGRKTRTFERQTDAEIVATIAGEHRLIPAPSPDLHERYAAVFQHDQTDLEFLLQRAARTDCEIFV